MNAVDIEQLKVIGSIAPLAAKSYDEEEGGYEISYQYADSKLLLKFTYDEVFNEEDEQYFLLTPNPLYGTSSRQKYIHNPCHDLENAAEELTLMGKHEGVKQHLKKHEITMAVTRMKMEALETYL